MATETEKLTFDEGSALMDMLDMLRDMLSEARRDYDRAIDGLDVMNDPNASEYQIQIARENLTSACACYDTIEEAHAKALTIYQNMIREAAGLPPIC